MMFTVTRIGGDEHLVAQAARQHMPVVARSASACEIMPRRNCSRPWCGRGSVATPHAIAKEIAARVAHMRDHRGVEAQRARHQRRPHARAACAAARKS
jgi:hypothetical protein